MEWLLLGAVLVLTAGTGVFVAAEFSLITVDRSSIERQAEDGDQGAQGVLKGLKTLSTQLSGAQVGITLTTLVSGFLIKMSLAPLLMPLGAQIGLPESTVEATSVVVAVTIATVLSMLFGELVPKNLAISLPDATARWSVPLQRAFTWAAGPVITVLNNTANRALSWMGLEPQEELSSGRSPEELVALVQRSAEQGTLAEGTAELLTNSLSSRLLTAADVMTPRVRMHTVDASATVADVVKATRKTGLSRFPVVEGDIDEVVGFVHVKGAIGVPYSERAAVPVTELVRPIPRVPETLRLNPLMSQLRSGGWQVALVEDEYGGTAGIVTLEDVVEEIVGEVHDEHDADVPRVRRLAGSGAYVLPGLMRTDEVRKVLGLSVEDSGAYETMAGFMNHRLERLAQVKDFVELPEGRLVVDRLAGRRVDRLRFVPSGTWVAMRRQQEES